MRSYIPPGKLAAAAANELRSRKRAGLRIRTCINICRNKKLSLKRSGRFLIMPDRNTVRS